MKLPHRVLVLDDDRDSGHIVRDAAQGMGIPCFATTDPMTFLESVTPETTLIFLDLVMPELDGIELLRILGQRSCKANIVLMSGADKRILQTAEEWAETLGLSIVGHLQKPVRLKDLETMLGSHQVLRPPVDLQKHKSVIYQDDDLRRAIRRDEFELHFQPQIELATNRVVGVEGLVRWQHPVHGLIFPDDFIGRAEELNLIDQLGWIVANRGLAEVGKFADKTGLPLKLSLNVSAYSLHDLKFPDTLLSLLKKYGVSAENLIFEITESGLIKELSTTLDVLTRLRMNRVNLSIDDFGTGYSMMRQLRRIPATELKIEKAFVQNIQANDNDRVLVEKTIEIGHDLGMKVVAEGVETVEQLDFLRLKRCDIAQGYFFSRPLPVEKLLPWLEGYRSQHIA